MKRVLFGFAALLCSLAQATDFHVYYLGGQSNMDGYGYVNQLPDELNGPVDGVPVFHGNTSRDNQPVDGRGVWSTLQPGHGVGFSSDGKTNKYSGRFGVELTFARTITAQHPESPHCHHQVFPRRHFDRC